MISQTGGSDACIATTSGVDSMTNVWWIILGLLDNLISQLYVQG